MPSGLDIPIQSAKSTLKPLFERSISNGFRSKEAPFNFLTLTYNGHQQF